MCGLLQLQTACRPYAVALPFQFKAIYLISPDIKDDNENIFSEMSHSHAPVVDDLCSGMFDGRLAGFVDILSRECGRGVGIRLASVQQIGHMYF